MRSSSWRSFFDGVASVFDLFGVCRPSPLSIYDQYPDLPRTDVEALRRDAEAVFGKLEPVVTVQHELRSPSDWAPQVRDAARPMAYRTRQHCYGGLPFNWQINVKKVRNMI